MSEDSIIRDDGGRFVVRPEQARVFTSETARAAANKRWAASRAAGVRAAVEKLQKNGHADVRTGADVFAVVLAHHVELLLKSERPLFSDIEKLRGMLTGTDGPDSQRANGRDAGGVPAGAIVADASALLELIQLIENEREKARALDAALVE